VTRRVKIIGALVLGALLGTVASFLTAEAVGGRSSEARLAEQTTRGFGEVPPADLQSFAEFPLYGLPADFMGLQLLGASRVSAETLAAAAHHHPPLETIGTPRNSPESRGHEIRPDFLTLRYGTCDARGECESPIRVQIWQACNRSLDDYELAPGVPYPHHKLTIRGTEAAELAERLELYPGSVTVVLFAERRLARLAADALVPLNGKAIDEMARAPGDLPASNPGPECA
jgi:hypothetical protein